MTNSKKSKRLGGKDKKADHERRLKELRTSRTKGKNPKGLDFVDKQRLKHEKKLNENTNIYDSEIAAAIALSLAAMHVIISRRNREDKKDFKEERKIGWFCFW